MTFYKIPEKRDKNLEPAENRQPGFRRGAVEQSAFNNTHNLKKLARLPDTLSILTGGRAGAGTGGTGTGAGARELVLPCIRPSVRLSAHPPARRLFFVPAPPSAPALHGALLPLPASSAPARPVRTQRVE